MGKLAAMCCAFCSLPVRQELVWSIDGAVILRLNLCQAHTIALKAGDWALAARCADMVTTIQGSAHNSFAGMLGAPKPRGS